MLMLQAKRRQCCGGIFHHNVSSGVASVNLDVASFSSGVASSSSAIATTGGTLRTGASEDRWMVAPWCDE
jgi:hypothetical protein